MPSIKGLKMARILQSLVERRNASPVLYLRWHTFLIACSLIERKYGTLSTKALSAELGALAKVMNIFRRETSKLGFSEARCRNFISAPEAIEERHFRVIAEFVKKSDFIKSKFAFSDNLDLEKIKKIIDSQPEIARGVAKLEKKRFKGDRLGLFDSTVGSWRLLHQVNVGVSGMNNPIRNTVIILDRVENITGDYVYRAHLIGNRTYWVGQLRQINEFLYYEFSVRKIYSPGELLSVREENEQCSIILRPHDFHVKKKIQSGMIIALAKHKGKPRHIIASRCLTFKIGPDCDTDLFAYDPVLRTVVIQRDDENGMEMSDSEIQRWRDRFCYYRDTSYYSRDLIVDNRNDESLPVYEEQWHWEEASKRIFELIGGNDYGPSIIESVQR